MTQLLAGPNRASFAAEVAGLVLQELRSSGGLSSNAPQNNNHNHSHHDNNDHDNQNHNNDHEEGNNDDLGVGGDLITYRARESRDKAVWKVFLRGSKMTLVEDVIDISGKDVSTLWLRWHFADQSLPGRTIPPWRRLHSSDFIPASNYRKASAIIADMLQLLGEHNDLPRELIGAGTVSAAEALLTKALGYIIDRWLAKKGELGFKRVVRPANVLSMKVTYCYDMVNLKALERKKEKETRDAQLPVDSDDL